MPDHEETWWIAAQLDPWMRTRDIGQAEQAATGVGLPSKIVLRALREALASGAVRARDFEHNGIERAFWEGKGGAVFVGDGRRAGTLYQSYGGIEICASDCMKVWPAPAAILSQKPKPLIATLDELGDDLRLEQASQTSRWFLQLPNVEVTGLVASGTRVRVDDQALADGHIDRYDDSVRTRDGRLRWSAVTVALANTAARRLTRPPPRSFDDHQHLARYEQERAENPRLSIRQYVLDHDREIEGASPDAKIRRLQEKLAHWR